MKQCTYELAEVIEKVVFLDFDGVTNNFTELDLGGNNPFSKSNVEPINKLFKWCSNSGVKIVISSAWNIAGTKNCKGVLSKEIDKDLVDKVVIGSTRYSNDLPHPVRNNEILEWLDQNPNVKSWLAIDDHFDFMEECRSNVMMINGKFGFLKNDLCNVVKYFEKENE